MEEDPFWFLTKWWFYVIAFIIVWAVTVFVHVYFDYHAWRREQEEGRQEDAVRSAHEAKKQQ